MTSFNTDFEKMTITEWNNSVSNVNIYPLTLISSLKSLGSTKIYSYDIQANYKELTYTLEKEPVIDPTLLTFDNNTIAKVDMKQVDTGYAGFTFVYIIKAKAMQGVDGNFFLKARDGVVSRLNKAFEKEAYLGTGFNNGLITGVTAGTITYTTDKGFADQVIAKAKLFNENNGKSSNAPVICYLSGDMAERYLSGFIDSNNTLSVKDYLATRDIVGIVVDNAINSTNRVDFVAPEGLLIKHGKTPQSLSGVKTSTDDNGFDWKLMHVGYQTIAINREDPAVVQSFLKA